MDVERALLDSPKYKIRSDLLYELLTYGDGLDSKFGLSNWNMDHGPARPVLTLIAMRAFDVYRLPGKPDRCFCRHIWKTRYGNAIASLDAETIADAVADARDLYQHTQKVLSWLGFTKIRLNRSLFNEGRDSWGQAQQVGYASFVSQVDDAACRLGRPSFLLPMDILSSWCMGPYSRCRVVIEHEIAIEDVVWCSALIASRDASNPNKNALEGGEWVVLNRSIDGCVTLPAGCVVRRPDEDDANRQKKWRAPGDASDLTELLDKKALEFEPMSSTRHEYMWPAPQELSFISRLRRSWNLFRNRRVV